MMKKKNALFNKFRDGIKDVDDAVLGREVKKLATEFRCPGGNLAAHTSLASRMLVFCTEESSSFELKQEIKTASGKFIVKVERITK